MGYPRGQQLMANMAAIFLDQFTWRSLSGGKIGFPLSARWNRLQKRSWLDTDGSGDWERRDRTEGRVWSGVGTEIAVAYGPPGRVGWVFPCWEARSTMYWTSPAWMETVASVLGKGKRRRRRRATRCQWLQPATSPFPWQSWISRTSCFWGWSVCPSSSASASSAACPTGPPSAPSRAPATRAGLGTAPWQSARAPPPPTPLLCPSFPPPPHPPPSQVGPLLAGRLHHLPRYRGVSWWTLTIPRACRVCPIRRRGPTLCVILRQC